MFGRGRRGRKKKEKEEGGWNWDGRQRKSDGTLGKNRIRFSIKRGHNKTKEKEKGKRCKEVQRNLGPKNKRNHFFFSFIFFLIAAAERI